MIPTAWWRAAPILFGAAVIVFGGLAHGEVKKKKPAPVPETVDPAEAKIRKSSRKIAARDEFKHLRARKPPKKRKGCDDDEEKGCSGCKSCQRCGGPGLSTGGAGIGIVQVLLYVLVGGALLFCIAMIIQAIIKRTQKSSDDGSDIDEEQQVLAPQTPPGEIPADVYVKRAIEMSTVGDHKGAIRQLLLGTMSWIERAGYIRFRLGLTNRDYLRAIWRQEDRRTAMQAIVEEFEQVYFGRREPTRDRFQRCLSSYRAGFDRPPPEPEPEPEPEPGAA